MFEPGDIVECVDASPGYWRGYMAGKTGFICLGSIYTVAEQVGPNEYLESVCVRLAQVRLPIGPWGTEGAFNATRFRLLKRRDPDLIRKLMTEPVQENA